MLNSSLSRAQFSAYILIVLPFNMFKFALEDRHHCCIIYKIEKRKKWNSNEKFVICLYTIRYEGKRPDALIKNERTNYDEKWDQRIERVTLIHGRRHVFIEQKQKVCGSYSETEHWESLNPCHPLPSSMNPTTKPAVYRGYAARRRACYKRDG